MVGVYDLLGRSSFLMGEGIESNVVANEDSAFFRISALDVSTIERMGEVCVFALFLCVFVCVCVCGARVYAMNVYRSFMTQMT